MKKHIYIILTVILTSCGINSSNTGEMNIEVNKTDTNNTIETAIIEENSIEEDTISYATFYIVIADTNFSYYTLHKKMFDLNRQLNIPIDTLGRFFNTAKNLIALPDNDEDEDYAGNYFPRRFPSENLSLEYLEYYQKQANEKTIALVSGIYDTPKSADSALSILQKFEKNAFKIKANIYVGCMH